MQFLGYFNALIHENFNSKRKLMKIFLYIHIIDNYNIFIQVQYSKYILKMKYIYTSTIIKIYSKDEKKIYSN